MSNIEKNPNEVINSEHNLGKILPQIPKFEGRLSTKTSARERARNKLLSTKEKDKNLDKI